MNRGENLGDLPRFFKQGMLTRVAFLPLSLG